MIVKMLNLACAKGHRSYAPPRELDKWIGSTCLRGNEGGGGSCQSTLRPIDEKTEG